MITEKNSSDSGDPNTKFPLFSAFLQYVFGYCESRNYSVNIRLLVQSIENIELSAILYVHSVKDKQTLFDLFPLKTPVSPYVYWVLVILCVMSARGIFHSYRGTYLSARL